MNYFYVFKNKVLLNEAEEEKQPEEPEKAPVDKSSEMEKVLNRSTKITYTLNKLLSTQSKVSSATKDQLRELISDIRCISYKPTTFRIILSNDNYFDLKYDPTPLQVQNKQDHEPSDEFVIHIMGKKYSLANKSELEQAVDYIQKAQKEKAIMVSEPGEGEDGAPPTGDDGESTPEPPEEDNPEDEKV